MVSDLNNNFNLTEIPLTLTRNYYVPLLERYANNVGCFLFFRS